MEDQSTLVAEHFTANAVRLQATNRLNAQVQQQQQQQQGGSNQVVVGGFVRSYCFYHVEGGEIFQGKMWVQFGARQIEVPVTVVPIGGREEDGKTGARIVKQTAKVSDVYSWVLDAHFSTYCQRLGQHVVVYEAFLGRFNFDDREGGEAFFEDEDGPKEKLTSHWCDKIRNLMDFLDSAQSSSVTHGGLNERRSYVLCNDGIKLIDVSRNARNYTKGKDLTDLRSFINSDGFFGVQQSSPEWYTLDRLLGSILVKEFKAGWKDIVLGHPILQPTAHKTIQAIRGVYRSKEGLSLIDATKLANWLHWWWPELYKASHLERPPKRRETDEQRLKRLKRLREARQSHLRKQFAVNSSVITALFAYTTAEQPIAYGGQLYHLEAINLGRNMIHHGAKYMRELQNVEAMLRQIRTHFGSYFSFAYFLVHTLSEVDSPDGGPYKCEDTAPPPPPTANTIAARFPPGFF